MQKLINVFQESVVHLSCHSNGVSANRFYSCYKSIAEASSRLPQIINLSSMESIFAACSSSASIKNFEKTNLNRAKFAALKGKYRQAVRIWKSELKADTGNHIRMVHSMLYTILELTRNLDEIAELVDWVAQNQDDEVLAILENSLLQIFRQFFASGFATYPPSYTGSVMTSSADVVDGCRMLAVGVDANYIRKCDLKPEMDHFLLRPETFVRMLLTRKQVSFCRSHLRVFLLVITPYGHIYKEMTLFR